MKRFIALLNSAWTLILFVVVVALFFVWFASSQEAAAYNRLTGGHATWWDAVWVELRVIK